MQNKTTQLSFLNLIERIENLDREMRNVKEALLQLKRELQDNDETLCAQYIPGEDKNAK